MDPVLVRQVRVQVDEPGQKRRSVEVDHTRAGGDRESLSRPRGCGLPRCAPWPGSIGGPPRPSISRGRLDDRDRGFREGRCRRGERARPATSDTLAEDSRLRPAHLPSPANQFRTTVVGVMASRPSGATKRNFCPVRSGRYFVLAMPIETRAWKRTCGRPGLERIAAPDFDGHELLVERRGSRAPSRPARQCGSLPPRRRDLPRPPGPGIALHVDLVAARLVRHVRDEAAVGREPRLDLAEGSGAERDRLCVAGQGKDEDVPVRLGVLALIREETAVGRKARWE